MRKTITLNTFRRVNAAEEAMLRAVMPRTSAADPLPLPRFAAPVGLEVATRSGSRLLRTVPVLTFKLSEARNAQ